MNKRQNKLFELRWYIAEAVACLHTLNRPSLLAHALFIVCEGTSFEEDARKIIEQCHPEYFKAGEENDA